MAPDPEARVVAAPVAAAPVAAAKPVVVAAAQVAPQTQVAPTAPPRKSLMEVLFGSPASASPARSAVAVPTLVTADLAGPASGQIACWPAAPKLERVLLRAGGTALVCTRGDGTLTGWLPPRFPQGTQAGSALSGPQVTHGMMAGATLIGGAARTVAAVANNAIPKPPKGYKLAWDDDRLNPMRGVGTLTGQAQQDQVWTRDVPAVLVAEAPPVQAAPRAQVTVSTMSAPQATAQAAPAVQARPAAQGGASYVQVGTFGQPANAEGVKARLKALGLPVSTAKITSKGKVLQVVYAGPFRSAAEAQTALGMARGAGFGDAILK
jgi:cell division septation protein DedD